MGAAYLFKRRFDEAAAKLLLSIQDHARFPHSYRLLAACYAQMGRLDEAREIVAKLRTITALSSLRPALAISVTIQPGATWNKAPPLPVWNPNETNP
jgi:hypothetical protein